MNRLIELHDSKVLTIRDVDGTSDAWDGISTGNMPCSLKVHGISAPMKTS